MGFIEQVTGRIAAHPALAGVKIVGGYPAVKKASPLKKPEIAVFLKSIETVAGGLGDYLGFRPDGARGHEQIGKRCRIVLGFSIYLSVVNEGKMGQNIFSKLCEALLAEGGANKISCGELGFSNECGCYALPAEAEFLTFGSVNALPAGLEANREVRVVRK